MPPIKKVNRIESLTTDQRARMPEWVQKWTDIGLRTGPPDRDAFERHVKRCYDAAGLAHPKRIVWTSSPFAMALAAPTASYCIALGVRLAGGAASVHASVLASVHASVGASVGASVHDSVLDSVLDSVRASVGDSVGDNVLDSVGASVGASVGDSVIDIVRNSVHASVDASVGDNGPLYRGALDAIRDSWWKYQGGQFWVGGWYYGAPCVTSYLREVCGLDLGDEMNARAVAYAGTCESACWWWPHKDFVMVCERPMHIDLDARGRLHSESRQAIAWPDGWGLYRWHGTEVPADVVEHPEQITIGRIDAEKNQEIRRIMIERYGTERFIRDSGARCIDVSEWPIGKDRTEKAELYRRDFADGTHSLAAHVWNGTVEPDGTVREFWLRIHPECRPLPDPLDRNAELGEPQKLTALAAVASTYGLRAEDYQLGARA